MYKSAVLMVELQLSVKYEYSSCDKIMYAYVHATAATYYMHITQKWFLVTDYDILASTLVFIYSNVNQKH